MHEEWITPEKAHQLIKVIPNTLRVWNTQGKIRSIRTQGGHRRYALSDVLKFQSSYSGIVPSKHKFCYARVSTRNQKKDLEKQIEFFRTKYPDHQIISDIGSGLNFKRKGLLSILDTAIQGNLEEVILTHKDRLCRFGFDLIERLFSHYSNGKIVVLNQQKTSPEEELVNDLLSIITVFSSRLYGLRSHTIKKQIKEATKSEEKFSLSSSSDS